MIKRKANGRYEYRWVEGGHKRGRTFDRKGDAEDFETWVKRRRQLGQAAVPQDVPLAEFVETYWRLHAVPNLSPKTRDLYKATWVNHIRPRLGDYGVRELTVRRVMHFRAGLEQAGVGQATVLKAMTVLQSMLRLAIAEEIVEFNAAKEAPKPAYIRVREPVIMLPPAVEAIRAKLALRDRTLVSVLAYSGPRPEEALRLTWADVGAQAIGYDGRKTRRPRHTPLLAVLAEDLREWRLASGRPTPRQPVFPAHDGGFWADDDWRNWRRRVWKGEPERMQGGKRLPARPGCGPDGTRPRDLRSSFVTLRVYEGQPLTQIAREVGTSVAMIERHYAGVIANWDSRRVPADEQIRAARRPGEGRGRDARPISDEAAG